MKWFCFMPFLCGKMFLSMWYVVLLHTFMTKQLYVFNLVTNNFKFCYEKNHEGKICGITAVVGMWSWANRFLFSLYVYMWPESQLNCYYILISHRSVTQVTNVSVPAVAASTQTVTNSGVIIAVVIVVVVVVIAVALLIGFYLKKNLVYRGKLYMDAISVSYNYISQYQSRGWYWLCSLLSSRLTLQDENIHII